MFIKVLKHIKLAIHLILEQLFLRGFLHHFKVFEIEKYFVGLDNLSFDKIMFLSFSSVFWLCVKYTAICSLANQCHSIWGLSENKRIAWACEGVGGRGEVCF